MSIIAAAAAATTQPADEAGWRELLLFSVAVLPGLAVLWLTRAYRPRSVEGPLRVPPAEPLWPVPVAIVMAVSGIFLSSILYGAVVGIRQMGAPAATQPAGAETFEPTATDLVVLSAAAPVVALAAGFGFLVLLRPAAPRWLGLSLDRLPRGVAAALLAAVFAIPATFLVSVMAELVYRTVGYQHPPEHELLKSMKEAASPSLKWTAIAAAVLVAPLVEEFIFRGLLQTSLVTWFVRLGRPAVVMPPAPPYGAPVPPGSGAVASLSYPPYGLLPPPLPARDAAAAANPAGEPGVYAPPPPKLPEASAPPLAAAVTPSTAYGDPYAPSAAVPPGGGMMAVPVNPLVYAVHPLEYDASRPRWVQAWLAILITSALFAIVHPLWTAPIIFFLSVALGYVYERTGNLWVPIGLHALFNATSTALYLLYPT